MFLLRQETDLKDEQSFYDFVPYKYGPFSFALYWELESLSQNGYLRLNEKQIQLLPETYNLSRQKINDLSSKYIAAIETVITRYGELDQRSLIREVYKKYPWYAANSELHDLKGNSVLRKHIAPIAVYTV
jgi:uncharacterized phage-associated protein